MKHDEQVALGSELEQMCMTIGDRMWHLYFESICTGGGRRNGSTFWSTVNDNRGATQNLPVQTALETASALLKAINSRI